MNPGAEAEAPASALDRLLAALDGAKRERLLRTAHQIGLAENASDPLWRLFLALQWHLVLYERIPAQIQTVAERFQAAQNTLLPWPKILGFGLAGFALAALLGFALGWHLAAQAHRQLNAEASLLIATDSGRTALQLARRNDFSLALTSCEVGATQFAVAGRRACYVPLWLDGPPLPDRHQADRAFAWLGGFWRWLAASNPLGLFLAGFLVWPVARRLLVYSRKLSKLKALRWLFDLPQEN